MDAEYQTVIYEHGRDWPLENALFVQTAVISTNVAGFVTSDAGPKAFALNGPKPRVVMTGLEKATYDYAGDDHGRLHLNGSDASRPSIGDVIECVVSHNDPTVALYGQYHSSGAIDWWPCGTSARAVERHAGRSPTAKAGLCQTGLSPPHMLGVAPSAKERLSGTVPPCPPAGRASRRAVRRSFRQVLPQRARASVGRTEDHDRAPRNPPCPRQ